MEMKVLTRVAPFPPEDMTTKAVEAFFYGTGSLLFLWNQQEASSLVPSVYSPEKDSKPVSSVEAFAMSAVGSYCDSEGETTLFREKFLHFFLYMLGSIPDVSDLRCMRPNVNAPTVNPGGWTALQAAAESGNTELVQVLLDVKADVNAPAANSNGRTALQAISVTKVIYLLNLVRVRVG
jgi:hypothetical protein